MVRIITRTTKKKVRKRPKDAQPARTKEGKELIISIVLGSYLTHNPSNVACKQIVRGLEQAFPINGIFIFIA
jgi:hypothetical protein